MENQTGFICAPLTRRTALSVYIYVYSCTYIDCLTFDPGSSPSVTWDWDRKASSGMEYQPS